MTKKTKRYYESALSNFLCNFGSVDFGDDWCDIKIYSDNQLEIKQILKIAKLFNTEDINFTARSHGCPTCGYGAEAIVSCRNCKFMEIEKVSNVCGNVQNRDECSHCGKCTIE